jgi:hypothetical protein
MANNSEEGQGSQRAVVPVTTTTMTMMSENSIITNVLGAGNFLLLVNQNIELSA